MKQRNIRKKRALEDEEEGPEAGEAEPEVQKAVLEDIKLLQKQRKRTTGISSSALAASRADDADLDEGNELMESYVKAQGGAAVMTEEQHMERFVELEVARRLGKQVDDLTREPSAREREEQALYEVPAELKVRPGHAHWARVLSGVRPRIKPAPGSAVAALLRASHAPGWCVRPPSPPRRCVCKPRALAGLPSAPLTH